MPFGDRQIPKEAGIPSGVMKGAIQIGKQHKTQGAWDGSSPKASSPGIRALKQSNRSSPTKYTENSVMEGEEDKLIAGWGARRRSDADDSSTHGGLREISLRKASIGAGSPLSAAGSPLGRSSPSSRGGGRGILQLRPSTVADGEHRKGAGAGGLPKMGAKW